MNTQIIIGGHYTNSNHCYVFDKEMSSQIPQTVLDNLRDISEYKYLQSSNNEISINSPVKTNTTFKGKVFQLIFVKKNFKSKLFNQTELINFLKQNSIKELFFILNIKTQKFYTAQFFLKSFTVKNNKKKSNHQKLYGSKPANYLLDMLAPNEVSKKKSKRALRKPNNKGFFPSNTCSTYFNQPMYNQQSATCIFFN
jgi:hypothetical protein